MNSDVVPPLRHRRTNSLLPGHGRGPVVLCEIGPHVGRNLELISTLRQEMPHALLIGLVSEDIPPRALIEAGKAGLDDVIIATSFTIAPNEVGRQLTDFQVAVHLVSTLVPQVELRVVEALERIDAPLLSVASWASVTSSPMRSHSGSESVGWL